MLFISVLMHQITGTRNAFLFGQAKCLNTWSNVQVVKKVISSSDFELLRFGTSASMCHSGSLCIVSKCAQCVLHNHWLHIRDSFICDNIVLNISMLG